MTNRLTTYLGRAVGELLNTEPFSRWRVVRSVEHEPKEQIRYVFEGRGFEVICDGCDRVRTMFITRSDFESLAGVPFSIGRQEVMERFGAPARSGGAVRIPGIGDRGPWDRFMLAEGWLHVQYRLDRDEVEMITLMRADAVP